MCGEQATGRCARDGVFFCVRHKRTYPRTVADFLEQAGHGPLTLPRSSGPPLQVQVRGGTWTLLCPSCFQDAIDKALPEIAKHLTNVEHGSIERMVIRLIRSAGAWRDSVNEYHPIGPDIVTAVVGHQPKWLFDNEVQTMAALYATIARARSLHRTSRSCTSMKNGLVRRGSTKRRSPARPDLSASWMHGRSTFGTTLTGYYWSAPREVSPRSRRHGRPSTTSLLCAMNQNTLMWRR